MSIYPNPAHDYTKISFPTVDNSTVTVKLFNVFGQEISMLTESNSSTDEIVLVVNLGDLKPGIYFVSVDNGEEVVIKKLIVE